MKNKINEMLKCVNQLDVVTNRSRNLIHFLSNRRVPTLEVQFRSPSRGPVIKGKKEKLWN